MCAVIPVAGQRTHGTTLWALKVTSQVATLGAESAICDCSILLVSFCSSKRHMSLDVCVSFSFSAENESILKLPGVTLAGVSDDVTLATMLYAIVLSLRSLGGVVENVVLTSSPAGATVVVTSPTTPPPVVRHGLVTVAPSPAATLTTPTRPCKTAHF